MKTSPSFISVQIPSQVVTQALKHHLEPGRLAEFLLREACENGPFVKDAAKMLEAVDARVTQGVRHPKKSAKPTRSQ